MSRVTLLILIGAMIMISAPQCKEKPKEQQNSEKLKNVSDTLLAQVGVYYFDGWAGKNRHSDTAEWAKNAPELLTQRLVEEFPDREPIWGWRDDSLSIMEQQINVAADNGIYFFAFDWYWHNRKEDIEKDPKNGCVNLFLNAKNNNRMKFCLLVANHQGFEIKGDEEWKRAADIWLPLLKDKRHLTVDGKPLIIIFLPKGGSKEGFEYLQKIAKDAGLPGVAIAACYEGSREMGYTHRTLYNCGPGYHKGAKEFQYSELAEFNRSMGWGVGSPEQPCIPCVTSGWDLRPWEGPKGISKNTPLSYYFIGRTPELFKEMVQEAIEWMQKNPEKTTREKIMLIYAWNEYGEGGYIAPTKGDKDGSYLKALRSVVIQSKLK